MKRFFLIILIFGCISSSEAEDRFLTLEDCIKIALENNTNILNAQANREDYRLRESVAQAGFMPTISASIDYTHQEYKTKYTPFQLQSPFFINRDYSTGLNLSQTIWDGGYALANFDKSKADYQVSRFEYENTRQTLIYSVEEAYFNLLKRKQLLAVYEETLKGSMEALKKAESMAEVGAAARSDVLKARVKVEEDQLNLITAQKNLDVARANLNYLMGLDVNEAISVAEIAPPVDLNLTYENAVKIALENHPALKKAQYQTRSAQKEIKMAYSAILPQLKGSYHFGYSSPAFDDMLHPFQGEYNWSAGVTLSLRLFDGLSSQANISRAKIWKRVAQDNYNQVQRDVCLELKAAYVGLEEAKKSIAVATERVLSAEEDLKLSTARYELGSGTMLEQIDAQTALTSARAQKIQAEYDYCFAQSRVKKAIGLLK